MPLTDRHFPPTPVVTASGHAARYDDTWARVRPLLRRVPVTRVVDLTPIDPLGLPVWSAVTPLARDLTVHAGKGATAAAARLSAVMEAIERVTAEDVDPARVVRASYESLRARAGDAAVDPASLDLPFDTTYRHDLPIDWLDAWDLARAEPAWVPLDAVLSPAREGVCRGVETNGLASGNTLTEAAVHALYELIERDAVADDAFCEAFGEPGDPRGAAPRMVDVDTLPAAARPWLARLRDAGMEVHVKDLTHDTGVPVYAAYLVDPAFPGASRDAAFEGMGCDLLPSRAAVRAVTEVVQAHAVRMLGARDDYEGFEAPPERAALLLRRIGERYAARRAPFPDDPPTPGDLRADLDAIVARLRAAGLARCLVADLTRADLGVPVVRALVPGLAGPFGDTARRPTPRLLRRLV